MSLSQNPSPSPINLVHLANLPAMQFVPMDEIVFVYQQFGVQILQDAISILEEEAQERKLQNGILEYPGPGRLCSCAFDLSEEKRLIESGQHPIQLAQKGILNRIRSLFGVQKTQ